MFFISRAKVGSVGRLVSDVGLEKVIQDERVESRQGEDCSSRTSLEWVW